MADLLYNYRNYLKQNFKFVIGMLILLLSLSLMIDIKPFIFLMLFSIANALFMTYERYMDLNLDFQLCSFSTILMTVKYGLIWGILTAVFTKLAHIFYNRDLNMNSMFAMSEYVLVALAASVLPLTNIISLGMAAVAVENIYGYIMSKYVLSIPGYQIFLYSASNIICNLLLILGFSHLLLGLMA